MVKVQGQRFGYRSTDLERRVKAGDRTAILPAVLLYCSMYHDIPMPKWLKRAFIDAFCSGDSGEAGSWDKVFGRPRTRRNSCACGVRWILLKTCGRSSPKPKQTAFQ
jgi:hypothetical protein